MVFEFVDYRDCLKAALSKRIERNPRYSLRAMAKQLGIAHSSLSAALSGKACFTQVTARKVSDRLDLTPDETEYFCLLVQLASVQDPSIRASLFGRLRAIHPNPTKIFDLNVEEFEQISEWYHVAILELALLDGFEPTPVNISARIGISKAQAEAALERLLRLRLLETDKKGHIHRPKKHYIAKSNGLYPSLHRFYKQMLGKTALALDTQTTRERVSGFEMLPLSESLLPEARQIIEDCFSRVVALSASSVKKDRVYYLSTHFFNVTSPQLAAKNGERYS